MSLRTKGVTLVGFLSTVLMGMSGGGLASAASTPVKLSDNPDSPQSITLTHVIHDAYPQSNAKIHYMIAWCDAAPALSTSTNFRAIGGDLEYVNSGRDSNGDAVTTSTVPFSDYSFSSPGTYEFCAYESTPDSDGGIASVDPTKYKIIVDVVNEYDENGEATGNLIPTLVPQALNLTTGEKGEILFSTTAKKTSMQFTHNVAGPKADREHYFPYDVSLSFSRFIARGTKFDLTGLDAEVQDNYTGATKTNPTEIAAGSSKVRVYLKEGQTLKIGQKDGKDDLPIGSVVTIEAVTGNTREENYTTTINNQLRSSIESTVAAQLGENPTEEQLAAFQENNDIRILRTSQDNAVSTGLVVRVMPFVALVFVAGIVGFVAYKSDKKKLRSL